MTGAGLASFFTRERRHDPDHTLMTLVPRHDPKAEGVLCPMSERARTAEWPAPHEHLAAYGAHRDPKTEPPA